jgi:hypothetical protein
LFYEVAGFYIICCIPIFCSSALHAQERKIIQYSGIVTTVGSGLPVGYATVTNLSFRNEAFAANNEGYFSFVAHVGDTIRFTSVGFDPLVVTIPEVPGDKYTANIIMQNLVTELDGNTLSMGKYRRV